MCNDGKYGKLKYMALLQKAVNNQVDMITIELDDVEMFCKKEALAPDSDMGDSRAQLLQSIEQLVGAIELHVPRYQGFFYEICDTEQPARDENYTDEASATRVRNAVQDWRERLNAKDAAGGLDKAMGVPAKLKNPWGVRFKPRSSASSMSMRQIRGDSVGQLVQLDCLVVSVQQVKPKVQIVTYHCETCGCEVFQSVEADTYTPPKECPSTKCKENKQSGNLHRMVRSCAFTRHEEVKVQELAEHVPAGGIPRTMTVQAEGDLTRMVKPGQSITLTGVFFPQDLPYAMRMRQQSTQKMFIEAHHFQKHKSGYSETVADEGALENKIAEAKKRGSLYEAASKSIAPEIFGHQDLKKALLLVLIGAPTKQMKDGLKIRGDIHTLMMGDPGVAKSQLLKQVTYIAPRSVYTSGKGSSSAGLTASVNRDNSTGDVTLEGGALVMADCGVCCIDEFDKMDEKDRTAIHEVMEQQTISIAKAGLTTTLNCRTTVLAAANPVYGRYNPYKSPVENIDLPAALLSRFDLVFLLLDTVDGDRDKQLSRHVADVRSKYQKQEPLRL
ncbi:MCM7 [Symbiodinium microadriaticum]|nr:MCM7 [Symbiodinium microadriaticum]